MHTQFSRWAHQTFNLNCYWLHNVTRHQMCKKSSSRGLTLAWTEGVSPKILLPNWIFPGTHVGQNIRSTQQWCCIEHEPKETLLWTYIFQRRNHFQMETYICEACLVPLWNEFKFIWIFCHRLSWLLVCSTWAPHWKPWQTQRILRAKVRDGCWKRVWMRHFLTSWRRSRRCLKATRYRREMQKRLPHKAERVMTPPTPSCLWPLPPLGEGMHKRLIKMLSLKNIGVYACIWDQYTHILMRFQLMWMYTLQCKYEWNVSLFFNILRIKYICKCSDIII